MADINTEIKRIVEGYLKNAQLSDLVYGTYTGGGLKIDGKPLPIPADMVIVPKMLKEGTNPIKNGDKVAVLQKTGGQKYYVLDRM